MKQIARADMAATINGIEKAGQEQFQTFAKEHLIKQMKEVKDVIKLNQFALFRNPRKSSLKAQENIASLKPKCNLFSQLYIPKYVKGISMSSLLTKTKHVPHPF